MPKVKDPQIQFLGPAESKASLIEQLLSGMKDPRFTKENEEPQYNLAEFYSIASAIYIHQSPEQVLNELMSAFSNVSDISARTKLFQNTGLFLKALIETNPDEELLAKTKNITEQFCNFLNFLNISYGKNQESKQLQQTINMLLTEANNGLETRKIRIEGNKKELQSYEETTAITDLKEIAKDNVQYQAFVNTYADDLLRAQLSLYDQIDIADFHGVNSKDENNSLKKIQKMEVQLTHFVTMSLYNVKSMSEQKLLYKFYYDLIDACLKRNDFETGLSIINGLGPFNVSSYDYLKDDAHKDQRERIDTLFSFLLNMKNLRAHIDTVYSDGKNFIQPYPIIRKDLQTTEELPEYRMEEDEKGKRKRIKLNDFKLKLEGDAKGKFLKGKQYADQYQHKAYATSLIRALMIEIEKPKQEDSIRVNEIANAKQAFMPRAVPTIAKKTSLLSLKEGLLNRYDKLPPLLRVNIEGDSQVYMQEEALRKIIKTVTEQRVSLLDFENAKVYKKLIGAIYAWGSNNEVSFTSQEKDDLSALLWNLNLISDSKINLPDKQEERQRIISNYPNNILALLESYKVNVLNEKKFYLDENRLTLEKDILEKLEILQLLKNDSDHNIATQANLMLDGEELKKAVDYFDKCQQVLNKMYRDKHPELAHHQNRAAKDIKDFKQLIRSEYSSEASQSKTNTSSASSTIYEDSPRSSEPTSSSTLTDDTALSSPQFIREQVSENKEINKSPESNQNTAEVKEQPLKDRREMLQSVGKRAAILSGGLNPHKTTFTKAKITTSPSSRKEAMAIGRRVSEAKQEPSRQPPPRPPRTDLTSTPRVSTPNTPRLATRRDSGSLGESSSGTPRTHRARFPNHAPPPPPKVAPVAYSKPLPKIPEADLVSRVLRDKDAFLNNLFYSDSVKEGFRSVLEKDFTKIGDVYEAIGAYVATSADPFLGTLGYVEGIANDFMDHISNQLEQVNISNEDISLCILRRFIKENMDRIPTTNVNQEDLAKRQISEKLLSFKTEKEMLAYMRILDKAITATSEEKSTNKPVSDFVKAIQENHLETQGAKDFVKSLFDRQKEIHANLVKPATSHPRNRG